MKSTDEMARDLRVVGHVVDSMDEGDIRKAYDDMDDDDREALQLERQGRKQERGS